MRFLSALGMFTVVSVVSGVVMCGPMSPDSDDALEAGIARPSKIRIIPPKRPRSPSPPRLPPTQPQKRAKIVFLTTSSTPEDFELARQQITRAKEVKKNASKFMDMIMSRPNPPKIDNTNIFKRLIDAADEFVESSEKLIAAIQDQNRKKKLADEAVDYLESVELQSDMVRDNVIMSNPKENARLRARLEFAEKSADILIDHADQASVKAFNANLRMHTASNKFEALKDQVHKLKRQ